MSHKSGADKRLDSPHPLSLPPPQATKSPIKHSAAISRADKPHTSMHGLLERALAHSVQCAKAIFLCIKSPKEGGRRKDWKGQPGSLERSLMWVNQQACSLPSHLPSTTAKGVQCHEGESKKKFLHTMGGTCQGKSGWVSCIFFEK